VSVSGVLCGAGIFGVYIYLEGIVGVHRRRGRI
jgi:hypothetical protein